MIFVFEIRTQPGYSAEQYADAWLRASEIIQQAPGARGTRLHRKIGSDRTDPLAMADTPRSTAVSPNVTARGVAGLYGMAGDGVAHSLTAATACAGHDLVQRVDVDV